MATSVTALLALAAAGGSAAAQPDRPSPHGHAHVEHFVAQGLVAGISGGKLSVLANVLRVGHHLERGVEITVKTSEARAGGRETGSGRGPAGRAPVVGDRVVVAGWVDPARPGDGYQAQSTSVAPAPATVVVGTVATTTPPSGASSGFTLSPLGDNQGSHPGGQSRDAVEADPGSGQPNGIGVDTSGATVTVDGTSGGTLAAGDVAVVVGESEADAVAAAQVYAFSTLPALLPGVVTAVGGSTVTVTAGDGSDQGNGTPVDLTGVPVVLDGTTGRTVADLQPGDRILVVGTTAAASSAGTAAMTPSLAIAFDHADHGPVGTNGGGGGDG
ncbi:hypothetical protein GHK86_03230 [Acidimicrobiaceae bacterium USS-CC1]|uniref:DUF5666 domain-containing protein n=1 Tax=Acidiferrimicrobium australe TaxID=2664430 RepID=A0ABW9QPJ5_9ACTN|nr:hypothetical protein [Acidiferrimicrobium australe]